VRLLKDRASRPYAFVQYKKVEDADKATEMAPQTLLNGRLLRIERAKVNRTLFIAKIDRSVTNTQLREICEGYGAVENVTIIKNHQTNRSKGCGFVKYLDREDARRAFEGLKTSKKWVIEWANSTNDPDEFGIDKTCIFVGGLNPSTVTKELIEARFGEYGKIESVTLVNKEAGAPQEGPRSAFAFLRFSDPMNATQALESENGAEWLDRRIRVQYCESQDMKMKRRASKYFAYMNELYVNPGAYYMMPPMYNYQNPVDPSGYPVYYPYVDPMTGAFVSWGVPHQADSEYLKSMLGIQRYPSPVPQEADYSRSKLTDGELHDNLSDSMASMKLGNQPVSVE